MVVLLYLSLPMIIGDWREKGNSLGYFAKYG